LTGAGGEVSLAAAAVKKVMYKIFVTTADERGVGTDAGVHCVLYGALGDSGELALERSETHDDPFERGNTDIFSRELVDLGEIQRVRIWHDGKGMFSSWKLDRVVVLEEGTQSRYEFPCGQWLSKSKGDKQLLRELSVGSKRVNTVTGTYKLEVATDSEGNGGCSGPVTAVLVDAQGERLELKLSPPSGVFAPGTVEHLAFPNELLLDKIVEVKLKVPSARRRKERKGRREEAGGSDDDDDSAGTTGPAWRLEFLTVKHLESGRSQVFKGPDGGVPGRASLRQDEDETAKASAAASLKASVETYEVSEGEGVGAQGG
jgi:hypothetical protein